MIEKLESASHLVAFRISGSLTAEDVVAANKTVEDAIEAEGRISMFVEIDAAMKFTLQGVLKDISEGVKNWKYLDKIYRTAVVTDHKWMAAIARIEGLVFSGIDLKVFPASDRAKAMVWASEVPPPVEKPEQPTPSIHFLQTTSDNVFAYEVNGRVRERDIKNAVEQMKPFFEKQGKINVLARIKNLSGFDVLAFIDDDLIKLKFRAPAKIGKYAVVGAKPWMRNLVELFNPIISTKIRTFEADEEDAAWEWVGASQALLPE